MIFFKTNQLWSCAFGFWTCMSVGPGTQSLSFEHLSLNNECGISAAWMRQF